MVKKKNLHIYILLVTLKFCDICTVAYGIERMNKEVSCWMQRDVDEDNPSHEIPFIATRGYDSVVWNRLYSKDSDSKWKVVISVFDICLK